MDKSKIKEEIHEFLVYLRKGVLSEAQTPAPETDPEYEIKNYSRLLQLARAGLVPDDMVSKMTNVLKDPKRFGVSPKIRNQLYDLMIKTLNYIVVSDPAAWARFRAFLMNEESDIKNDFKSLLEDTTKELNPTGKAKVIRQQTIKEQSLATKYKPGEVWTASTGNSWGAKNKAGEVVYFNKDRYPDSEQRAKDFASGKVSKEDALAYKRSKEDVRGTKQVKTAVEKGLKPKDLKSKTGPEELNGPDSEKEALGTDLKKEQQIATRINQFAELILDREKQRKAGKDVGEDPDFDLCTVTVPGTNLYCNDTLDIPRKRMPQLKTTVKPGSKAEELLKKKMGNDYDPKAEFNAEGAFLDHLRSKGVKVKENETMAPTEMKATQNELVGAKVMSMVNALVRPDDVGIPKNKQADVEKALTAPLIVSRDGYVLDGHHRWAALTTADLLRGNGGSTKIKVIKVDMDIEDLVDESNEWGDEFGLQRKTAKQQVSGSDTKKENVQLRTDLSLSENTSTKIAELDYSNEEYSSFIKDNKTHSDITNTISEILKKELAKYSMYA